MSDRDLWRDAERAFAADVFHYSEEDSPVACDETEALRCKIDVLRGLKDRAEAERDEKQRELDLIYTVRQQHREKIREARAERDAVKARFTVPIVCLCGSTRFSAAFRDANVRETLAGKIVLSIGCDLRSDEDLWADPVKRDAIKMRLDELHKRKIDLCDSVLVVSVGGYFGCSTESEIRYAISLGKPVLFLELEAEERWNALA